MNGNRRFLYLMLILSIILAFVTAHLSYHVVTLGLSDSEHMIEGKRRGMLKSYRKAEFVENISSDFVREWKKAKTLEEQNRLWRQWTGNPLPSDPWIQNIILQDSNDPTMQLSPTVEEIAQLIELGWETAKNEPLPLTPMGVSYVIEERAIKAEEEHLQRRRNQVPLAPIFGAFFGFGAVWTIYAPIKFGILPVFIWITNLWKKPKLQYNVSSRRK